MASEPLQGRESAKTAATLYRPDIDGLRAIAVTAVVLYHAGVPGFRSGFVGVDIFFVISGFLIGGIVFRGVQGGNFSFTNFYARRAMRIVPALVVVVLVTLLVGLLMLSPTELQNLARSAGSAILAISNFHFWKSVNYFTPTAELDPMLMTWSLGVEEQFYVFFPFVLLALRRFGAGFNLAVLAGLTLVSFGIGLKFTHGQPVAAFYLLPPRAWELGVGVCLAIWMASGRRQLNARQAEVLGVAGLCGLLVSLFVFDPLTPWPGVAATLPVLATGALIAAGSGVVSRHLLAARPMVAVGLVSYSWYLWHWPIMAFSRISVVGTPSPGMMASAVVLSLVLAVLSWRYVEQPFRHSRIGSGPLLVRYAAVLAGTLLCIGLLLVGKGLPGRVPTTVTKVETVVRVTHEPACVVGAGALPNWQAQCIQVQAGQRALALVGDSHAGSLIPAFQDLAQRTGQGSAVFSKASCPPLARVTVSRSKGPDFAPACAAFMTTTFDWVARNPDVHSVILAGLWAGPLSNPDDHYQYVEPGAPAGSGEDALAYGLQTAIGRLRAAGKKVFVVEDTPYWGFDPVRAMLSRLLPLRRMLQGVAEPGFDVDDDVAIPEAPLAGLDARLRRTVQQSGATYLETRAAFCSGERCRYARGEELLFADKSHVTPAGAAMALAPYQSLLTPAP